MSPKAKAVRLFLTDDSTLLSCTHCRNKQCLGYGIKKKAHKTKLGHLVRTLRMSSAAHVLTPRDLHNKAGKYLCFLDRFRY